MSGLITITERFIEGRRNMRIMAGVCTEGPEIENQPGRRRRLFRMPPTEIILFERWAGNDHGTILSEMIAFTGGAGGRIPEVDQPVEILMHLSTWRITQRFYPVYDRIRETGTWTLLSPTWWRICGARINANVAPPSLDPEYLNRCASSGYGT